MALRPRLSDIPTIRAASRWYRVSAYITGTLLLLLVLEMVLKYTPIQREIELGGSQGLLALVPNGSVRAVNLSTAILIAHGWLYVVYLFTDFRLWSFMRWPFSRFIQIALGGVVPLLSFIVEHSITARVHRELAELQRTPPVTVTEAPNQ